MIKRYLEKYAVEDLKDKMVFISGPRQVGKTTFAKQIGETYFAGKYEYLNWDNKQDKMNIINAAFHTEAKLIIFDEIHKYKNWKNHIKGIYDKKIPKNNFLVTGSAKLDIYKKGGDSLLGRYYSYRLHPLSLNELLNFQTTIEPFKDLNFHQNTKSAAETMLTLLKYGGFPEIFVKQNEKVLRRWHNEKNDRLIKEDIRDIENLKNISLLQILVNLIPNKVGSLFSVNSLKEDIGVTHKTMLSWVNILEKFYYHFRIYPYNNSLIKSLRKEPKIYLWDWSEISDESIKLENFIASHLLKFTHFLFDEQGYKAQLYFLRDKEQREVDFLVCIDNKPWFCVEVKKSEKEISPALNYFSKKLNIPYNYQVVGNENIDYIKNNIRVISASKFLTGII